MNYHLSNEIKKNESYMKRLIQSGRDLGSYLNKKSFLIAVGLAIISSATAVVTPYFLGHAIDTYIVNNDSNGLMMLIFGLFGLYVFGAIIAYYQQTIMGRTSQKALYKLRATIFEKIQELPLAFFNQNKTGDLMSRINNDTDKLSQFLSEGILRFVGSAFTLIGIGSFVIYLNWRLGLVLLSSTVVLVIITRFVAPFLERANRRSSGAMGDFTAGVSEQLTNFKAIIAFDRRNFFESFLGGLNQQIFKKSLMSDFLNKIFEPIYDFAKYIAQVMVLAYGVYLVTQGDISFGVLISFLAYAMRFYEPLQYIADIFGSVQVSLASWGRVRDILMLTSNLDVTKDSKELQGDYDGIVMMFDNVGFGYTDTDKVLSNVSFALRKGSTYALVGPTGGGKSTIAGLMSRLHDPSEGTIYWKKKDMKSYESTDLSKDISVILQEPYMFSGTVADNIRYGNHDLENVSDEELEKMLDEKGMGELLKRLPEGLKTKVETGAENISIGQKQLISFVRTVLRGPKLLILDEATANIDTVTESTLQSLIDSLPKDTIKVIIAHRLNTIKNADEILFVSGGHVRRVGNEAEVLELLKSASKR